MARLYVIQHRDGVLHVQHLDGVKGEEFKSEIGIDIKGGMYEKGWKIIPGENRIVTKWNNHYSKKE